METDCSALVRVCVNYAGIAAGDFRTTNEASVLTATGAFEKRTDDAHCKKSARLLRGDILVTKTQGHTVVVLSDGSEARKERVKGPSVRIAAGSGGTVHIRCGNSTDYAVIGIARTGETYPYVAAAENGWNAVEAGDRVGWVSGKYSVREQTEI